MAGLTAEQLVEEAEKRKIGKPISEGYTDNKADFGVEAIITLLDAGADVTRANSRIGLGFYYNEVIFKEYRFMSLTNQPIRRLNM